MQQPIDDDDKPVQKQVYTQKDLIAFQSSNIYSSIGKMLVSQMPTSPNYGFGTSDRQKQTKVYQSEELSRTHFVGKTSLGPKYEVRETDKYYFKNDPNWTFGKQNRNTLGMGSRYAYYSQTDNDFEPAQADSVRKNRSPNIKIGLESRFSNEKKLKGTPGPEYDPSLRPEIPNSPKFSFGERRDVKGASPLILLTSTPKQVGPGSYVKIDQGNTSLIPDQPKYSFPKDSKLKDYSSKVQKNQTYDTRSSIGGQVSSKNRSMTKVPIGKAKKDYQTGIFKDMMATQPTQVRIQMPRF